MLSVSKFQFNCDKHHHHHLVAATENDDDDHLPPPAALDQPPAANLRRQPGEMAIGSNSNKRGAQAASGMRCHQATKVSLLATKKRISRRRGNLAIKSTILFSKNNNNLVSTLLTVILYTILIALPLSSCINAIAPTIDYSHNMRILKLPKSTQIGSLIYRLKGSDGDPNTHLVFGVSGIEGRALLDIVPVARSWNEADVFLRSQLDESIYNLTIYVTDGTKTTQVESTIHVTDDTNINSNTTDQPSSEHSFDGTGTGSSTLSPFINAKHVFHVPENTMPDEPIGFVTVLESQKSDLPVRFELRGKGAEKFSIKYVFGPKGQSKAEIVLAQRVDYEKQNLFNLKVLALNAWTNSRYDTRNVATLDIVITVGDVQDTAPIFRNLPQSVKLYNTMQSGDTVLKVEAEDGDYADQRPVNFALDANSPLSAYFDIDKLSGDIKLMKPISELAMHAAWDSSTWSMLTVFASEVPDMSSYDHLWPPMYTKAELPLILVDLINEPPQFIGGWQTNDARHSSAKILHGYLSETPAREDPFGIVVKWYTNSSETGSPLVDQFSKSLMGRPAVLDLGLGSNGTFELTLEGPSADIFQLDPVFPVTKQTTFTLFVGPNVNRSLFDHEHTASLDSQNIDQRTLSIYIVAKDFGTPQRQSSRIKCLIELLDINDNAPQFDSDLYSFQVYENAPIGQSLGSIRARDSDSGASGRVRYTLLTGLDSHLFHLNQDSGQITLDGHLDREKKSLYLFIVEARDSNGAGLTNHSQILINVLDVNDNPPVFLQSHYDAVLLPDGTFHQPLVVRAVDADEPGTANSQVAYEIIAGNQNDQFSIDTVSGVIYPTGSGDKNNNVLPQIPPILSEPIVPFGYHSNQPPDQAGKILPPSHEVEETTFPSPRQRHQSSVGSSSSSQASSVAYSSVAAHHHQQQHSNNSNRLGWPRSTSGADDHSSQAAEAADSSASYKHASVAPPPPSKRPQIIVTAITGGNQVMVKQESTTTTTTTTTPALHSNRTLQNGRLLAAPPMDTEQLPALDLLLNLESEQYGHSTLGGNANSAQSRSLTSGSYYGLLSASQANNNNLNNNNLNTMKVPPLTTLIVRAHDFGIPLRSSTVKVNIYNQALLSRSVSVILNGTSEQLEQRRDAIERAFSSMTGSKATIESIDALSESSSISVARVKLAVPQHSLVDLTDLSALMNAIDYHPHDSQQQNTYRHPTTITHYIATNDRLIPTNTMSSNITSGGSGSAPNNGDINIFAMDPNGLERRLLIYIIIVGVCILALLVIWMVYSCSREDQVKIIEKPAPANRMHQAGSYRPTTISTASRLASDIHRQQQQQSTTGNKTTSGATNANTNTYAKTADVAVCSPIGNNLAKSQKTLLGKQSSQRSAQQVDSSVSNMNVLLPGSGQTTTVKPDHYSMYNGQVWFEPNNNSNRLRNSQPLIVDGGRRASSAPSGGSLDSALHSAIGWRGRTVGTTSGVGGSATPRNATGQFFPNTVGYMENLASLTGGPHHSSAEAYSRDGDDVIGSGHSKLMSRRHRKRKVVPMVGGHTSQHLQHGRYLEAPNKPPRMSQLRDLGHLNEAFANDLESGGGGHQQQHHHHHRSGRHRAAANATSQHLADGGSLSSQSSSPTSSLAGDSVMLESDQELLGFDSTGTPIIATHTRAASIKPLVIDMLDPTESSQRRAIQKRRRSTQTTSLVGTGEDATGTGHQVAAADASVAPSAGSGAPNTQLSTKVVDQPQVATGGATVAAKPPFEPSKAQASESKREIGERLTSGDDDGGGGGGGGLKLKEETTQTATKSDKQSGAEKIKKANSQGDLMSELSERLSKRQRSVDQQPGTDDSQQQQRQKLVATANGVVPTTKDGGSTTKLPGRRHRSASSDDSASVNNEHLKEMKNGELLEKQSIFAITYSGLATDKLPGC